jgi:O-antigen biosynthesis protein
MSPHRANRRNISVVVPCYNSKDFVAETLESVLSQSYPWVDIVVVDDGSTDGSWEVIQSFGRKVRAFRKENGGAARARNFGASRAIGQSLLFLDADDLLSPDALEGLSDTLQGREDAIAACRWERYVHEGDEWNTQPAEIAFPLTDPDPLAAWLKGEWIAGCSLLWPAAMFERLGGYDETLTADEDGDLMYRALITGAELLIAPEGESFYRAHGSGRLTVSQDIFAEHRFRSRMRVFEKVEAALREQGRWDEYRTLVGLAYHGLAQRTFVARPDLANEALQRGEAYAGRQAVAPTLPGRILVRLLGMDGKERLVNALAHWGIMTPGRRAMIQRGSQPAPAAGANGEKRAGS